MKKKITLLAMAVAALAAFALPASASATATWTSDGKALGAGVHATQPYEGFLQFNAGAAGTFGCQVTVMVTAIGPNGGRIKQFNPTTSTCIGEEFFKGCVLTGDVSNVIEEEQYVWGVALAASGTSATVSKTNGGNLTIRNTYHGCAGGMPGSHLEFASVTVTPEVKEGKVTKLTIEGVSTTGIAASGSVTPEAPTATAPNVLGITGIT